MKNQTIYFAKMKKDAIIPSKREEDGAFDIYACFEEPYKIIKPHETCLVPTGLASAFSSDYVAILKERGSNGSIGLGQRAGVIDSGYRGEWFVAMTNHNSEPLVIAKKGEKIPQNVIIYPYEKAICQCILLELPKIKVEEVDYETILSCKSERGMGALGSSGK
jgi:dUTP pyrophosphatase